MFFHPSLPRLHFGSILQIKDQQVVLGRCVERLSRVLTRDLVVVLVGELEMPGGWTTTGGSARSRTENAAIETAVVVKGGNEVKT